MNFRNYLSALFILLQIGGIVFARFTEQRFFCWAPYDIQTNYKVTAVINNEILGPDELEQRYGYRMEGWEQRSIYNIFSIIEQYEATYGKNDSVSITANYAINGHEEQVWTLEH